MSTKYTVTSNVQVSKNPKRVSVWLDLNGETFMLVAPVNAFVDVARPS